MLGACGSPPPPAHPLLPACAESRAEGPMPCHSRAELPRGGRDGCAETGLPWKSSSSSGSAVTAPTVRRGVRFQIRVPGGERCCGDAGPGAGCPCWGGGGCVVLCSLKLGASLFQTLLNHLGSGTRGHALAFPAGQGLVPAAGQRRAGTAGGPPARAVPWGWREGGVPVCLLEAVSIAGLERPSLGGWGGEVLSIPGSVLPACGSRAGGTVLVRSLALLACAGTAPPSARLGFACGCSDGSRRVHPRCGSRVGERGGTPCLPPPSQSRALTGCCRERGSGFTCWHAVVGDAVSNSGSSPMSLPPEQTPSSLGGGGPSLRTEHHEAAPSRGKAMETPQLVARGGVGSTFPSSPPARNPALLGPGSLGKCFEAKGKPRAIGLGASSPGRDASGWVRGAAPWM